MAKLHPFWWFRPPQLVYVDLPVESFHYGQVGDWVAYGADPWLHSNDGDVSWVGWFGGGIPLILEWLFSNTALSTFQTVKLYIISRQSEEGQTETDNIYLHDGSSWNYVGGMGIAESTWHTFSFDVTSILDTITKINAAKMYFSNVGGRGAHITYAFLRVYYYS